MTTEFIERDALINTPEQPSPPVETPPPITHYYIPPPANEPLLTRVRSFFGMDVALKAGSQVIQGADGARYMFLISSNSYEDREQETITSKALEAYEASCYPGADVFYCDNPLLWFHDPDVPMGTIEAVAYIQPFLVEVAKELPNDPVAKVLWDFAESNGDNAGASIKFGYREEDRSPDGEYSHVIKLETSYLPERQLAANVRTYAGVLNDMSSAESNNRLDEIFEKVSGGKIKNAAELLHAKSGALKKQLAEVGLAHKAIGDPTDVADETEAAVDAAEDSAEMEAKAEPGANIGQLVELVAQIYRLVMEQVDSQSYLMEQEMALAKALKAIKDDVAQSKAKAADVSFELRIAAIEKQLGLSPRSVSQVKGTNPEAVSAAIKNLTSDVNEENLVEVWGFKAKPPIEYHNK